MKKIVAVGSSSAVLVLGLVACGPDEHPPVPPSGSSTTGTPTATAAQDGSGLRRNNSPSPVPAPTTESGFPHITLPHIPWPKREPGVAGE